MFSRKKAFFTIFLTAILVVAFMLAAMNANRLIFADKMRSRDANKLEAIARVLEELSSSLSETESKAVDQYEVNTVITATALENVISDGTDDAVASYGSGAVVRIENGRITAP